MLPQGTKNQTTTGNMTRTSLFAMIIFTIIVLCSCTNNNEIFSLSTIKKDPPEDVLHEINVFVGGGNPDCNIPLKNLSDCSDLPITTELSFSFSSLYNDKLFICNVPSDTLMRLLMYKNNSDGTASLVGWQQYTIPSSNELQVNLSIDELVPDMELSEVHAGFTVVDSFGDSIEHFFDRDECFVEDYIYLYR